jgi:hypothetical protein
MLQADVAVQYVARPVIHAAVLHFIRMKYLNPAAYRTILRYRLQRQEREDKRQKETKISPGYYLTYSSHPV